MALHRIRANMRFTASSGLAAWTKSQMSVRHGQAVNINPAKASEEGKSNKVVIDGDYENFLCDLPLSDLAHAEDAFNTLTDANVLGQAVDFSDKSPSWVEHHTCHHDETPSRGCEIVNKLYSPQTGTVSEWVQPTGAHDAYALGAQVLHNDVVWESDIDANTYEPGVYGWTAV